MRDIVDDEQRRDFPQPLCAQRFAAAQGHLPLRRSERGLLYFYHGLLSMK
jgi:hypothetical protein